MSRMAKTAGPVTGGVDTHAGAHVAAVIDQVGRVLGTESFPADEQGYARLLAWLRGHGELPPGCWCWRCPGRTGSGAGGMASPMPWMRCRQRLLR